MSSRVALLVNPPVYDTQYWSKWSQPHGLLRIGSYLKERGYETHLIDCLQPYMERKVRYKRRAIIDVIRKVRLPERDHGKLQEGEKYEYCFGKNLQELEENLANLEKKGIIPDEVWITSIMTYWWESTRDTVRVVRRIFPFAFIRLGGVYPTLCPEHACRNTGLDRIIDGSKLSHAVSRTLNQHLVVMGQIPEASNLWTDLSLYGEKTLPEYCILTTSRGCPYDCTYCAQKQINGISITGRDHQDVLDEIKDKYDKGIREFAFYEDNILVRKSNFVKILKGVIREELKIKLDAPEGFHVRLLDGETLVLMREAGFRKLYLPLETIDNDLMKSWNRTHVDSFLFEKVLEKCHKAGFRLRTEEISTFIMFGLPHEKLQSVIDTVVYASNKVGSLIPMLFTPVPRSKMFMDYLDTFKRHGWDEELHKLNGKWYPFLETNGYNVAIYENIERLMFSLNCGVKRKTFDPLGDDSIPRIFRKILCKKEKEKSDVIR
jgi:hypothetical protein